MKKRKGLKITAAVLLILVLAAYSTVDLTAADLKVLLIRGDGDGEASIPGAQQLEATAREILWLMGQ